MAVKKQDEDLDQITHLVGEMGQVRYLFICAAIALSACGGHLLTREAHAPPHTHAQMGMAMGVELERQTEQLGHLTGRVEYANERLHGANNRLERQL